LFHVVRKVADCFYSIHNDLQQSATKKTVFNIYMQFFNPFMLWGILAVAVPLILHFWHQKKGQLLNWAATTWLIEKKLQPSKGIRLENLLLLILRCLLLIILAIFLSKPLINLLKGKQLSSKVHLVQANNVVLENYKFELEEALKKGEKLFWINERTEPLTTISKIPNSRQFSSFVLQSSIYQVAEQNPNEQIELYFVNSQNLAKVPAIFIPNRFSLHTVVDSLNISPKNYLTFSNQKKLFINASNKLSSEAELDKNVKFQSNPIHAGAINILIRNKDKTEQKVVESALKAIAQVYLIEINIDFGKISDKKYDWTLDVPVSDNWEHIPEYLAENLIKHFDLNVVSKPLSSQQLKSLFQNTEIKSKANTDTWFSKTLLLLFIIILGIERFIALKKNA
jgi:Aerotolerance regulator N-terminal